MKQLYIITYENAHWCGGELHCLVWATDETDAQEEASQHMDECQRELFSSEYNEDDEGLEEDMPFTVNCVELLDESDLKQFVDMPDQSEFYPYVNEQ